MSVTPTDSLSSVSLASNTLEGCLVEAVFLYRTLIDPDAIGSIRVAIENDGTNFVAIASAILPITVQFDPSGVLSFQAVDELSTGYLYSPTDKTDLQAQSLPAQIMYLAGKINRFTPEGETDRVQMQVITDTNTCMIDFRLKMVVTPPRASSTSLGFLVLPYAIGAALE